ncbi:MAG: hypothetical protein V7L20_12140 [Nostoc sp.]
MIRYSISGGILYRMAIQEKNARLKQIEKFGLGIFYLLANCDIQTFGIV